MNVRLKKTYQYSAIQHIDDVAGITDFNVILEFYTAVEDSRIQNIALARVDHFFYEILQDSVIIGSSYKDAIKAYRAAGLCVVDLPEEAYDQIIGIMLYCKLNAICEGALVFTEVSISSDRGRFVYYLHNEAESVGPLSKDGWHHKADRSYSSPTRNKNVVHLEQDLSWRSVDLDYAEEDDDEEGDDDDVTVELAEESRGRVVKVEFRRDDNK